MWNLIIIRLCNLYTSFSRALLSARTDISAPLDTQFSFPFISNPSSPPFSFRSWAWADSVVNFLPACGLSFFGSCYLVCCWDTRSFHRSFTSVSDNQLRHKQVIWTGLLSLMKQSEGHTLSPSMDYRQLQKLFQPLNLFLFKTLPFEKSHSSFRQGNFSILPVSHFSLLIFLWSSREGKSPHHYHPICLIVSATRPEGHVVV